jgi:hypothetical protein
MKINLIKLKRSSDKQLGAALTTLKCKICKKYAQMVQLCDLDATLSENILQYYIARLNIAIFQYIAIYCTTLEINPFYTDSSKIREGEQVNFRKTALKGVLSATNVSLYLKQRHEVVLGRARGRNCLSLVFLH